ncbi:MAG: HAMP domain-containing histidine kinase [Oscillospiraceae bacterium]|nr:HAMP domain-containing histidine kinase [Oscillospiraceae bacterium]
MTNFSVIAIIACGIFAIGFAAVLIKLLLIKRDIRKMGERLNDITQTDTNAELTTQTFDKDVVTLVQNINSTLERNRQDYFELKRTEAILKRTITNISHDLRTPLTAAHGYLQMLESAELSEETRVQYIKIIDGRLNNLGVLMSDLFEFSRIIEGSMELEMSRINLGNALRDALSDAYVELENKCFAVETDISDTPVMCFCDVDALRRVLQNLLKNVCVHGKEFLRVRLIGNRIEISNRADDLDKIDIASIFERLYTADSSRSNKNTGLGLAIAKELTERMDGKLEASVEGDMFTMRLEFSLCN